ncbi:MAG: MogA/MoaB family molybdenum cofactor biosynthesis protein [Candidatus Binatia bacterium]|jgi:molybdenum cofactor biosynthesis protein B
MSVHEHRESAIRHAGCAVLTISDTRTRSDDRSGARLKELLAGAGHEVLRYDIVPDNPVRIREALQPLFADSTIQAIFLSGGTGIAPRDTTFEAVRSLLEKEIEGFGELFRALSYQEIGAAAMLSRATAGIVAGKIVFSMPGSTAAVELAMEKLALPELGHALRLLEG